MTPASESSKLIELRGKTDRQLAALIDTTVTAARTAGTAEAKKIYEDSLTLLPLIYSLSSADRRRLECKLQRLGESLLDISSDAALKLQAACS